MATVYSDTVTILRGEDTSVPSRVLAPYRSRGRLRIASGIFTTAACNAGDVIQMCWVPQGARIVDGYIRNAALGANSKIGVGFVGKSAVQAANTVGLAANFASDAAALTRIPSAAIDPVTVTDPEGLYVTVVANNAAVTGKVEAFVYYIFD